MYSQAQNTVQKKRGENMQNKVKLYREKEKLTQEELAQKSEVSRNTISALETGANTNVTYEVMEKIANALNRKVATIFFNQ